MVNMFRTNNCILHVETKTRIQFELLLLDSLVSLKLNEMIKMHAFIRFIICLKVNLPHSWIDRWIRIVVDLKWPNQLENWVRSAHTIKLIEIKKKLGELFCWNLKELLTSMTYLAPSTTPVYTSARHECYANSTPILITLFTFSIWTSCKHTHKKTITPVIE